MDMTIPADVVSARVCQSDRDENCSPSGASTGEQLVERVLNSVRQVGVTAGCSLSNQNIRLPQQGPKTSFSTKIGGCLPPFSPLTPFHASQKGHVRLREQSPLIMAVESALAPSMDEDSAQRD